MATMNRNLNLEEVDNDGFMGFDFFKYQSVKQKIVFCVFAVAGIGTLLAINLRLIPLPNMLGTIGMFMFIAIGVLFGCNANKDYSLWQYIKLKFFGKEQLLLYKSTEDIAYINRRQDAGKNKNKKTTKTVNKQKKGNTAAQGKELIAIIVITGIVMAIVLFLSLGGLKWIANMATPSTSGLHHSV